ncbi:MAG: hypothetical protein COW63_09540 [Bacteroidetes bacterium CG18_big_fil_WC_8_21_14_2_50_41_14]|nr:MAG: hypothetical protein COW63_09540 [Bacteroidetes bacterium CG18_big_fil_WC_8_21_14_2_50_41_14]
MHKSDKYFELIRQQEASGFSVKEFCSNEGIAVSTFYYWIKKLRGQSDKNDFIPLIVNHQQSQVARTHHKPRHTSDSVEPASGSDPLFELVYPNGVALRVRKDIALAELRVLVQLFG